MIGICKIDWNNVLWMVEQLAKVYAGKRIWGIPRGGQVVAILMAYQGCKLAAGAGRAEVIVDDIADTGQTLFNRTHNTSIKVLGLPTAALVVRNGCITPPDHYIKMLNTKDYVLFPWETEKEVFEYARQHKGE